MTVSRHTRSGLSLVELLVAMALLSLVMGMGFVATSAMRRGYLVEARLASDQLEKATSLRQVISQFHNDGDFILNPPLGYPPDDPDTAMDETRFSLLPIRGRQAGFHPSGVNGGMAMCSLNTINPSTALIPMACINSTGMSVADMVMSLTLIDLPWLFPEWAAEPCLITQLTPDSMGIRITVANPACLLPATTAGVPSPPPSEMIRLPRLMIITNDRQHRQDAMLVETAMTHQTGIGLAFFAGTVSIDGMEWQRESRRPEDNFAMNPVNLIHFGGEAWVAITPNNDINSLQRVFTLTIQTPFDDTKIMPDCQQTEQDTITHTGLTYDGLTALVDSICFRHTGQSEARMLITISGGNLQWRRMIRLTKLA
jgi:prepilin-type N-terminal cleavage/methylation domain-containing protein